jgi:carotenoid cleavage dioxygenase
MGNLEPVQKEVSGALELLLGRLPDDLDGWFIRTGPNPINDNFGNPRYHEFDGDGMLHATNIEKGGRATYKNRYVQTKKLKLEQEKGRALKRSEAVDGDGSFLGPANTSVIYHSGKLLALLEVDKPYVISLPDLKTEGQLTYDGQLTHGMTAHPKICPRTGELIFFAYDSMSPTGHYAVANRNGKLVRSWPFKTQGRKPAMMHDMAITPKYSLLLEFPLYFDMKTALSGGSMPFVQDQRKPFMCGIVERHAESAEEIQWFAGRSAMTFHIANAWEVEESGQTLIKLIGCRQEHFSFEYGRSSEQLLHEWTFNLATGKTAERQLGTTNVEFPVVNTRLLGTKNRFMWASVFAGPGCPFHSVSGCIKYDLETGRHWRHDFLDGRWGGECVFAPVAGEEQEDRGYLLTYTYNPKDKTTELYVVNAQTMDPNPVAILRTPQRVPFGFHGYFLPRELE